ncbi:hypothetical protein [Streptomyces sp. NPDC055400]
MLRTAWMSAAEKTASKKPVYFASQSQSKRQDGILHEYEHAT